LIGWQINNGGKKMKLSYTIFLSLAATLFSCLVVPVTASAQSEKLGAVQYTPVKGWKKTAKDNMVAFSEVNEATGKFCIITLFGAAASTGKPEGDFVRDWNERVVKMLGAHGEPKTETEAADGWTMIAGGTSVDYEGTKALVFLTVMSGQGKTVSTLGLLNDEAYLPKIVAFNSSIEVDKTIAAVPAPQRDEPSSPTPTATAAAVHVSSIVREFEHNEVRAIQVWAGKRVRVYGIVNSIEIGKDGNIILTFKSSISTYNQSRCFFNKSQSSRVATLTAHEQATVEGTVKGLGGGFDNSKAFLLLENCTVP
jgi:tRNA_anti-like